MTMAGRGPRVFLLALICGSICAFAQAQKLAPGDLIYIEVYRVGELTQTTQVDAAGNVTLPYVGSVKIGGLAEGDAAARISQSLKKILRNPRVTVVRSDVQLRGAPLGRTSDMQLEIIPLHNSNAETIGAVLDRMSSPGGSVGFDPDTNSLIVTDTPQTIRNMMSAVHRLDQMESQLTQVRIEAKIAEVRVGALKEIGVRWFVQGDHGSAGFYPPPRQTVGLNTLHGGQSPLANETVGNGSGPNGAGSVGRDFVTNPFDRRLNIPVQIPTPGQTFLGFSNAGIDIGAMLDLLVTDDEAELLANPAIVTVNHKTAVIKMVDEFPFTEFGTEITGASNFSTQFMDLGIILEVTPHVYQDAVGTYVKLELNPEVSFPSGSNNGVPIRSVRSSASIANVRDGQTLVVGGILTEEEQEIVSRVPGIGDLPIIGALFRHKETTKLRKELMIFVTPNVHNRPEEITWDRMINISEGLQEAQLIPTAELRREQRKN